jgi:hypothetical protein
MATTEVAHRAQLPTFSAVDLSDSMELDALTQQVSIVEYHRLRLEDDPAHRHVFESELSRLQQMENTYSNNLRAHREYSVVEDGVRAVKVH